MGGCLSSSVSLRRPPPPPTAKVISLQGHLREYPAPISVSRVLQTENSSSSTSASFLCNSDRLYYDDFIPPLPLHDHLQADQIYFLLPSSNLHHRLTASQMAALAVKATLALQNASARNKNPARISPILLPDPDSDSDSNNIIISNKNTSPASSVQKLQRLTSRRAKRAVRSFKLRLSTIYEGTTVL